MVWTEGIRRCRCYRDWNLKLEDLKVSHTLGGTGEGCLLWNVKERPKDKTYKWMSVRWKTTNWSWGIYTSRMTSVGHGTGTPKYRDEVNRRDVSEWDGWVCVLDVIDTPSILRLTRKPATLTRVLPTLSLRWRRNSTHRKWKSPPLVDWGGNTPETVKKTVSFPMSL
jgi:hypothetical protein